MLVAGTGITATTKAWGTQLLQLYGTTRLQDYTTQWLGFSTDNGLNTDIAIAIVIPLILILTLMLMWMWIAMLM